MTANTSTIGDGPGGGCRCGGCRCGGPVPAVGSVDAEGLDPADLAGLLDELGAMNRVTARAVAMAGALSGAGVAEIAEGMPLEAVLANVARLTGADLHTILGAAEVLVHMPVVAGLFATGELSWGQVRGITAAVRRRSAAFRQVIDARIDATIQELGGADRMAPDQLVRAVEGAVDHLDAELRADAAATGERPTSPRERSVESFLALQLGFDGTGTVYGEFDAVSMGVVVNALDATAGLPTTTTTAPGDDDTASGADTDTTGDNTEKASRGGDESSDATPRWSPRSRSRQHAKALVDIAARSLASGGDGRPAKPLIVAHIDIADITTRNAGTAEIALNGLATTISLATLDQLATDATLRTVLFDGATPLAVAEKTTAVSIPTATRIAVSARDTGDRFPASTAPIAWCDLHHIHERANGGTHHPTNLLALSRKTHRWVHRHGWTITRTTNSGDRVDVVAFDHPNGRRLYSTPTTTRLLRKDPPSTGPPRDPPATRPPRRDEATTTPGGRSARSGQTAERTPHQRSTHARQTGRESPDPDDANHSGGGQAVDPDLPF